MCRALILMLLGACSAESERRDDYLASHRETDSPTAEAIRAGGVRSGMTEAEVRASWGEPAEVRPTSDSEHVLWLYDGGRTPLGFPLGVHTVVFEKGKVVSVAAAR